MGTNPDIQALKTTFATLLQRSITQVPLSKLLSLTAVSSDTEGRISSVTAIRLSEALAHLTILAWSPTTATAANCLSRRV